MIAKTLIRSHERAYLIPYLQCRWGEEERKIVHMDI